jgi:hypothetical protein
MPITPLRYKAKRPWGKVLVVILIILLLLILLPLPLPFNRTLVASGVSPVRASLTSIDSVWLSGTWSTVGTDAVTLNIISADGAVVYNSTVGFGTFSFYAPDAPYTAVIYTSYPVTVQIGGTAWGPLIAVGLP